MQRDGDVVLDGIGEIDARLRTADHVDHPACHIRRDIAQTEIAEAGIAINDVCIADGQRVAVELDTLLDVEQLPCRGGQRAAPGQDFDKAVGRQVKAPVKGVVDDDAAIERQDRCVGCGGIRGIRIGTPLVDARAVDPVVGEQRLPGLAKVVRLDLDHGQIDADSGFRLRAGPAGVVVDLEDRTRLEGDDAGAGQTCVMLRQEPSARLNRHIAIDAGRGGRRDRDVGRGGGAVKLLKGAAIAHLSARDAVTAAHGPVHRHFQRRSWCHEEGQRAARCGVAIDRSVIHKLHNAAGDVRIQRRGGSPRDRWSPGNWNTRGVVAQSQGIGGLAFPVHTRGQQPMQLEITAVHRDGALVPAARIAVRAQPLPRRAGAHRDS